MTKLKQYLENSWYRGASQDRQSGYAAQFQYGENVNIRDMKNGVCLSGGPVDIDVIENEFSYFSRSSKLLAVDVEGHVYDVLEDGFDHISEWDIGETFDRIPFGIEFNGLVYVIGSEGVFKMGNPPVNIAPQEDPLDPDKPYYAGGVKCILNYANTYLLISDYNRVWRYSRDGTFKVIREFDATYQVYGLTQEGNYLKIYVSDGLNTKIHYAKGTFDVEDTGLMQTVSFNGLSIEADCVTSDQGNDYVCFIQNNVPSIRQTPELKLGKISGYSKTDIKWTQTWDGEPTFYGTPMVLASDGILFVSTDEGIRTFTEYNGWLWGGCLEFCDYRERLSMFRFGERLYVCMYDEDAGFVCRYYDLSFHPKTYQPYGFIIGRVFDGGCAGLFKKNDQATITYNMPEGTSMELSYRYDRSSFGYDKSNFISIKKLTDVNSCYDIVVPTTPGVKDESILLKEDGDKILLENGNGILLEELMVCPFNKTRNLLEYRFDLETTDETKTPILFEHSLTYYDYMRKYR